MLSPSYRRIHLRWWGWLSWCFSSIYGWSQAQQKWKTGQLISDLKPRSLLPWLVRVILMRSFSIARRWVTLLNPKHALTVFGLPLSTTGSLRLYLVQLSGERYCSGRKAWPLLRRHWPVIIVPICVSISRWLWHVRPLSYFAEVLPLFECKKCSEEAIYVREHVVH